MQPSLAQTTPPHTPIPGTLLGNESHHDPLSAHILGIGTAFPPDLLMPQDLENFATKWCEPSERYALAPYSQLNRENGG
jgi:hypothetical protein